MKPTVLLLVGIATLGCVTGPEDVASQEARSKAAATPVNEPNIQQVSASTDAFEQTASGLRYRIMEEGTGKRPGPTSNVVCHYKGWLDNGKEFDSSYKRGEPTPFPLDGVIPAWTEGVQLIKEGGKIELEVPSELGYGASGMPPVIPPNARLHFIVELVKVK